MKKVCLFAMCSLLLLTAPNVSQAKEYNSCAKAFAFYLKDKSVQKAFATLNGESPNAPNATCGGTSAYAENSKKEVLGAALSTCKKYARKFRLKGKCKIIAAKLNK